MKIGTSIVSFALALIILLNSINTSLTYAYYYLDPIDFIEKLCENKDEPALQCNGKCQLKKVSEDYQSDSKNPTKAIRFERILPFVLCKLSFKLPSFSTSHNPIYLNENLYAYQTEYAIFHPPQV